MASGQLPSEWPWSIPPQDHNTVSPPRAGLLRRWGVHLIVAMLIGGALLDIPSYLQKWLWMRQLGYLKIFWTLLDVQWGMFVLGFVFAFLFFWSNVRQAIRSGFHLRGRSLADEFGTPWGATRDPRDVQSGLAWPRLGEIGVSSIVAWVFALAFSANWDSYLRFRYGGNYGLRDPLFGIDVGFYLFHLPFYTLEQRFLGYLSLITLAAVVAVYLIARPFQTIGGAPDTIQSMTRHVSGLLFVLVGVAGWGFYLDRYNLVYSTLGVVY